MGYEVQDVCGCIVKAFFKKRKNKTKVFGYQQAMSRENMFAKDIPDKEQLNKMH